MRRGTRNLHFEEIKVFQARGCEESWNYKIGIVAYFVCLCAIATIERDNWAHAYFIVRGENLQFVKDELLPAKACARDVFIDQQ